MFLPLKASEVRSSLVQDLSAQARRHKARSGGIKGSGLRPGVGEVPGTRTGIWAASVKYARRRQYALPVKPRPDKSYGRQAFYRERSRPGGHRSILRSDANLDRLATLQDLR